MLYKPNYLNHTELELLKTEEQVMCINLSVALLAGYTKPHIT